MQNSNNVFLRGVSGVVLGEAAATSWLPASVRGSNDSAFAAAAAVVIDLGAFAVFVN